MRAGVVMKSVNGSRRSTCIVSLALSFVFMIPCLFFVVEDLGGGDAAASIKRLVVLFSKENTCINTTTTTATAAALCGPGRKLLQSADGDGDGDGDGGGGGRGRGRAGGGNMNRVGTACSKDDITIFQGETAPLPNGIPAYTVDILNMCVSGCSIYNIHINCGWFSSARLVNPTVFRRMDYDDCLVNDGQPLGPGQSLSFEYANTFRYPLSVSSVAC